MTTFSKEAVATTKAIDILEWNIAETSLSFDRTSLTPWQPDFNHLALRWRLFTVCGSRMEYSGHPWYLCPVALFCNSLGTT